MLRDEEGHEYIFGKMGVGSKKIWRCRHSAIGCKHRVHTYSDRIIYRANNKHTHEPMEMKGRAKKTSSAEMEQYYKKLLEQIAD